MVLLLVCCGLPARTDSAERMERLLKMGMTDAAMNRAAPACAAHLKAGAAPTPLEKVSVCVVVNGRLMAYPSGRDSFVSMSSGSSNFGEPFWRSELSNW